MSSENRTLPIFTIGHSTRTIAEFVDLLQPAGVRHVVDVRTIPRSRTNPQYNADLLPETLAQWQIAYTLIPQLGGRRGRRPEVAPEVNAFWQHPSFHNYADYALSPEFDTGLQKLLDLGDAASCVIMCSEAVWWRCHRRIIADYLIHRGRTVHHLMQAGRVEPARMTPAAAARGGKLVYPA